MEPWISLPKEITSQLAQRAEEICLQYGIQRSNSDDLVKALSSIVLNVARVCTLMSAESA